MRESLALRRCFRLFRMEQGDGHQMFGEEPDLQFMQADQVAHDQVVRPIVAAAGSLSRHGSRFLQYEFMRVEEAGNLHGHLFTPSWRARN